MKRHDLIIIGSGSGNSILTPDFDGWDVAIVEKGVFGGTCLNRGCIPSKMLVYPAEIAELAQHDGPRLGVHTEFNGADWPAIRDRIFGRIDPISAGGEHFREVEQKHVTLYHGTARFTGERRMEIHNHDGSIVEIGADTIVLAAGARPYILPVIEESGVTHHTSDTIMRIDELPEHLIVVGGGYIGAELGNVFAMLGSEVTIINRSDVMLRSEDPDISRRFTDAYAKKINLITRAQVTRAVEDDSGIHLDLDVGLKGASVSGSHLLVATGRVPNGDLLDVEKSGVELDPRGYVVTDEYLRTGVDGIWALGDVTNPAQLKHTANAEARVVAHNIAHPDDLREIDRRVTPHAIFGHPQVAAVGLTEPEAVAAGIDHIVAMRPYGSTAYGWAMEDHTSVCKVIAHAETRQLLGAHIIGPQASTLIQQLIQGMTFGQTVDEMARGQLYIHPALSEVVEQALLEL